MAVVIETTLGDFTVDLYIDDRPHTCKNFLKLCKTKYYNFCLFHSVQHNFIAQTGDPTGTGKNGESIYGKIYGEEKKFFEAETMPKIKHTRSGLLSMVNCGNNMLGSQFFLTLGGELQSLDGEHCVFGEISEGLEILLKLNDVICDTEHRPYQDIRITHTVILEDPFDDPQGLVVPDASPEPSEETLVNARIAPDEELDETKGRTAAELEEIAREREAKAQATILEIVGDLPDADVAPPENVLFVCKLNPVTTDDDLEIIFSRFGKVKSCEVIRDRVTGDSLQYAFVEFEEQKACEDAYFKMDNVLIDDRRIHVDFSQSVSKLRWKGKGRGVEHFDEQASTKRDSLKNSTSLKDVRSSNSRSKENASEAHKDRDVSKSRKRFDVSPPKQLKDNVRDKDSEKYKSKDKRDKRDHVKEEISVSSRDSRDHHKTKLHLENSHSKRDSRGDSHKRYPSSEKNKEKEKSYNSREPDRSKKRHRSVEKSGSRSRDRYDGKRRRKSSTEETDSSFEEESSSSKKHRDEHKRKGKADRDERGSSYKKETTADKSKDETKRSSKGSSKRNGSCDEESGSFRKRSSDYKDNRDIGGSSGKRSRDDKGNSDIRRESKHKDSAAISRYDGRIVDKHTDKSEQGDKSDKRAKHGEPFQSDVPLREGKKEQRHASSEERDKTSHRDTSSRDRRRQDEKKHKYGTESDHGRNASVDNKREETRGSDGKHSEKKIASDSSQKNSLTPQVKTHQKEKQDKCANETNAKNANVAEKRTTDTIPDKLQEHKNDKVRSSQKRKLSKADKRSSGALQPKRSKSKRKPKEKTVKKRKRRSPSSSSSSSSDSSSTTSNSSSSSSSGESSSTTATSSSNSSDSSSDSSSSSNDSRVKSKRVKQKKPVKKNRSKRKPIIKKDKKSKDKKVKPSKKRPKKKESSSDESSDGGSSSSSRNSKRKRVKKTKKTQ